MSNDLVIMERYDDFLKYIYPKIQQIPKNHGIVKAKMMNLVLDTPDFIYRAIKSNQIGKMYELDAHLASIRHMMRYLANNYNVVYKLDENNKKIRKKGKYLLDNKGHSVSSILLSHVGKIVGKMIKDKQK